jgi:hypothetical protein
MLGDDDIFWVSRLHGGLMAAGFYPSDEEVENWLFGEGTQAALLMYQACNDVAETGMSGSVSKSIKGVNAATVAAAFDLMLLLLPLLMLL